MRHHTTPHLPGQKYLRMNGSQMRLPVRPVQSVTAAMHRLTPGPCRHYFSASISSRKLQRTDILLFYPILFYIFYKKMVSHKNYNELIPLTTKLSIMVEHTSICTCSGSCDLGSKRYTTLLLLLYIYIYYFLAHDRM